MTARKYVDDPGQCADINRAIRRAFDQLRERTRTARLCAWLRRRFGLEVPIRESSASRRRRRR